MGFLVKQGSRDLSTEVVVKLFLHGNEHHEYIYVCTVGSAIGHRAMNSLRIITKRMEGSIHHFPSTLSVDAPGMRVCF